MRYAKLSAIVLFASCLPACAAGPADEAPPVRQRVAPFQAKWPSDIRVIEVDEVLAEEADEDDEGIELAPDPVKDLEESCESDASDLCEVPEHIATDRQVAVFATFPDEARPAHCRGTVMTLDAVLIEAHCVYDEVRGGAARSVRVGSSVGTRLFVPTAFRNADLGGRKLHDYAVVRTAAPVIRPVCPALDGCLKHDGLLVALDEYEDDLTYRTIKEWALRPRTW